MKAVLKDHEIAASDDIVSVGGYEYFPPSTVRLEWLEKSPKTPHDLECPHGVQFYDVVIDGERHVRNAWSYESPQAQNGGRCATGSASGRTSGRPLTAAFSPLQRIQRRRAVTVLGIVPAFELRLALFGEGGAGFHQVAFGAVLMQRGGEARACPAQETGASAASCERC